MNIFHQWIQYWFSYHQTENELPDMFESFFPQSLNELAVELLPRSNTWFHTPKFNTLKSRSSLSTNLSTPLKYIRKFNLIIDLRLGVTSSPSIPSTPSTPALAARSKSPRPPEHLQRKEVSLILRGKLWIQLGFSYDDATEVIINTCTANLKKNNSPKISRQKLIDPKCPKLDR